MIAAKSVMILVEIRLSILEKIMVEEWFSGTAEIKLFYSEIVSDNRTYTLFEIRTDDMKGLNAGKISLEFLLEHIAEKRNVNFRII